MQVPSSFQAYYKVNSKIQLASTYTKQIHLITSGSSPIGSSDIAKVNRVMNTM